MVKELQMTNEIRLERTDFLYIMFHSTCLIMLLIMHPYFIANMKPVLSQYGHNDP